MSNMFLFKSKKIPNYFRFSLFYFSRMIYNKNRFGSHYRTMFRNVEHTYRIHRHSVLHFLIKHSF